MRGRADRSQLLSAFGRLLIGGAVVAAVDLRVAVDQGWLVPNVVDAARLPRAVEQPDQDRVVTPEEWAQIRLQLSGEGTVLMCDLALDCGLRYEEVIALRPMDVLDADALNASHLWIRQAITWPGRTYSGGDEPWLVGPTKGKRFRKVAVSAPVFHRLRLYIEVHGRQPRSLVFDYPLLRAEHAQARDGRPAPARFPTGRYITPGNGRTGQYGKAHTYALGCRCPYCRNANTEARFRARRAKGAQPAPWLDPTYLADRGDAVDPRSTTGSADMCSGPRCAAPRSAGPRPSTTCGTEWSPGRMTLGRRPPSCNATPATPICIRPRATCTSSTRSSAANGSPP